MRILHLIDAAPASGVSPTTLALLEASLGRLGAIEQRVALLGGSALHRWAAHAGVRADFSANVPAGAAWMGLPAAQRLSARLGRFDLIHCWSPGALTLAAIWQRNVPRVLTVTTPLSPRAIHWLRMLALHAPGGAFFLPISNTLRRNLIGGGVPEAAVHVVRPGLDMGRIVFDRRHELRESLGVDDTAKVVALLSDPCDSADARPAVMGVSLAANADDAWRGNLRLVMHPRQRHRRRATEIIRNLDRADRLICDERLAQPWLLLPACDLALALGPSAGGLSLLWAMAANIPIVAEATYAVSEIVEDRHSALLAKPDRAPDLAHRIGQLLADPQLAWKLRDTARHEAYSFFSRQRYCQSLTAVYEQILAGKPVEVPPMQVTGGLRYTGRA